MSVLVAFAMRLAAGACLKSYYDREGARARGLSPDPPRFDAWQRAGDFEDIANTLDPGAEGGR